MRSNPSVCCHVKSLTAKYLLYQPKPLGGRLTLTESRGSTGCEPTLTTSLNKPLVAVESAVEAWRSLQINYFSERS